MRVKLSATGFDVLQSASTEAAVNLARQSCPDVIVASCDFQDQTAVQLCQRLRSEFGSMAPPVLMLCSDACDMAVLQGLQAGATDVLRRPVSDKLLLARVRNLMRRETRRRDLQARVAESGDMFATVAQEMEPPRARVGLVAPPGTSGRRNIKCLRRKTRHEIELLAPATTLRRADQPGHDIFVLAKDQEGPEPDLDALTELRSTPSTRHAAIVLVLGPHQIDLAHRALDLGADDVMLNGLDLDELALRLERQAKGKWAADCLRRHVGDSLRAAVTDPLTGLHNRRYGLNKLAAMSDHSAQTGRPFAVMIADLDHFKAVNDGHGHAAGDAVLKEVACRLTKAMAPGSLLARIGGEEFLIAMPDTQMADAETLAKELCAAISGRPYRLQNGSALRSTMSIGLALCDGQGYTQPMDLIAKADRALYAAKTHGRNQVTVNRSAA